jgi:hypothetical protein
LTKRSDGFYDIVNVGTTAGADAAVKIAAPSGTETAHTLNTSGTETVRWDLEIKDNKLMCVDLANLIALSTSISYFFQHEGHWLLRSKRR